MLFCLNFNIWRNLDHFVNVHCGILLSAIEALCYQRHTHIASYALSSAYTDAEMIAPPQRRSPIQIGTGLPLAVVLFALPKA